ncbi:hypothetical protein [Spiroplasma endosymbiont of Cantharis rufa]|uniref:hypothetical protein n=1 Tax=Spiroplasma endosymbiont of Cantharis rufa TaxID=3066279 RepID=UPI0030CD43A3
MHKPRFLVLDEPTRGLDATISAQFYELILRFKKIIEQKLLFVHMCLMRFQKSVIELALLRKVFL